MKKNKFIVMAAVVASLQSAAVQYGTAQEIVPVNIHTLQATEDNGKLVYNKFGNHEYIARCAAENGITNTHGLFLVYDRVGNSIVVTDGTNAICTPLTFVDAAVLANTNENPTVERLCYVFTEGASIATGTMTVTEHDGTTNRLNSLVAEIQYWANDSTNGNGTAIYRGTITSSNSGGNGGGGNHAGGNGGGNGGGGSHTNSVPPVHSHTNGVPNNPKPH